ncbi:hypothetical protein [Streptomyces sp. NBC_01497]|uniref:hypothetical protein n=1 Tax=Streptomyces sp. NBC_01497 TaxID=2903885 RepID=UPI002E315D71|nr:hypothetical protein [Streptomyces sp. NBC_01497]
MSYRPYPDAPRALRQLDRHAQGPVRPLRRPSALERQLAEQAHTALRAMGRSARPVGGQPHARPKLDVWKLANDR